MPKERMVAAGKRTASDLPRAMPPSTSDDAPTPTLAGESREEVGFTSLRTRQHFTPYFNSIYATNIGGIVIYATLLKMLIE